MINYDSIKEKLGNLVLLSLPIISLISLTTGVLYYNYIEERQKIREKINNAQLDITIAMGYKQRGDSLIYNDILRKTKEELTIWKDSLNYDNWIDSLEYIVSEIDSLKEN